MPAPDKYPGLTRAGRGRPRGARNKLTKAMVELMERVLNDPNYQAQLIARIKGGRARHIEELFMLHALGRPTTNVELTAEVRRAAEVLIYLPAKDVLPEAPPRALPEGEPEDETDARAKHGGRGEQGQVHATQNVAF